MLITITRSRTLRAATLATLFVAGNLALPQIAHLVGGAGPVWLPIYFFTIIAAATCSLTTGIVTAIASVLLNHALFGMPDAAMLPIVMGKSVIICAVVATLRPLANRNHTTVKATSVATIKAVLAAIGAIALSALLGTAFQALITDHNTALTALRVSLPGLLLQSALLTTLLIKNK